MGSAVEVSEKKNIFSAIMGYKIGVLPAPIYVVLAAIVLFAAHVQKLPIDMIGGFGAIMVMGIFLGDVGGKIPLLKQIGGPAILCLFVTSALIGYKALNPEMEKAITAVMKTSNFLYLYIACLVSGSILGMHRKILVQGFLKMFVPLAVGTVAAVGVGILVGLCFGYKPYDTFFFIVVPILGGGIGEGVLPLSIAFSEILGKSQPELIAQLIPAALVGNVFAIVIAGLLKRFGEKNPKYSGNGLLVKTGEDKELLAVQNTDKPVDFSLMGVGLLIACCFFIFGGLMSKFVGIPGPIIMILAAALIKVVNIMPSKMEQGSYHMYRFISSSLTYPLLVGLGALYVPWNDLIKAFTPSYIIICMSVVVAMISSGFFIGFLMKMYPVESAIVTGCHSGLGGTGDVAILSASNRMGLMPFAQISTRIGGVGMVILAAFLLKMMQ
jgi:malate:Na+ symporter